MTRNGPLFHVVCHTCASDPEARKTTGTDEYKHESLTRNDAFAELAAGVHRNHGHDVSVKRVA